MIVPRGSIRVVRSTKVTEAILDSLSHKPLQKRRREVRLLDLGLVERIVPPHALAVGQQNHREVPVRDLEVESGVCLFPPAGVPDELVAVVLSDESAQAVGESGAGGSVHGRHHLLDGGGEEELAAVEGDVELRHVEHGRDDSARGAVAL